MNWNIVAAVSELIGTIAVVISLIYLALQVKQSNLASQEQTRQRMMELANSQISLVISNPEINKAFIEPVISKDDAIKFSSWLTTAMRAREYEWFSYKNRMIDKEMFKAYSGVIVIHLGTERARAWWKVRSKTNEFHPEFCEYVNNLLKDAPYMDHVYENNQSI